MVWSGSGSIYLWTSQLCSPGGVTFIPGSFLSWKQGSNFLGLHISTPHSLKHKSSSVSRILVLVSFLLLWQNTWDDKFIKRKALFSLPVLEISFHGWLFHCFRAWGEAEHHDRECVMKQARWPGSRERERETGGSQSPNILFKGTTPVISSPSSRGATTSQLYHNLASKPSTQGPLGTFNIANSAILC
jgi:hypothetical protein